MFSISQTSIPLASLISNNLYNKEFRKDEGLPPTAKKPLPFAKYE